MTGAELPRGVHIGVNNFTGGGWGEKIVAHEASCFALPDAIGDDAAVVIEPFGCCVHAIARRLPGDDETVLIYGAGTMGLCSVLAIRALGSKTRILVIARHRYQEEIATELGADVVLRERGRALCERVAAETGATMHTSKVGATSCWPAGSTSLS